MSKYFSGADGVVHTFPDDVTPQEVHKALDSAPSSGSFGGFPSGINPMNPTQSFMAWLKSSALKALPTAGGMAGGIGGMALGGPVGGIAGAGIGGAWGKGMQESASGERVQAKDLALSGGEQALYEATGQGLTKVAGKMVAPLLRRAYGVGRALPGAVFGDLGESGAREAVGVSPRGIAKVDKLREASSDALYSSLNQAKAEGWTAKSSDVVKHAQDLLNDPILPDEDKSKIARQLAAFMKKQGARPEVRTPSPLFDNLGRHLPDNVQPARGAEPVDPVLLKGFKQFYQNRAERVYAAKEAGALTLAQQNRALFAEKFAQGAQEQLERIDGVGPQEARTQSLIGLQRAVEEAYQRPPKPVRLNEPGSWLLAGLNGPRAISNYALFANHPAFKALVRQSPRLAIGLLMHELAQPDNTAVGQ